MDTKLSYDLAVRVYSELVRLNFDAINNDPTILVSELRAKMDRRIEEIMDGVPDLVHWVVSIQDGEPKIWVWTPDDPEADFEFRAITRQLDIEQKNWKGR